MRQGKFSLPLGTRLLGATLGALGLFFIVFQYNVSGAILLGVGGILMAIGDNL